MYLARIAGAPSEWQAATIDSLVATEWSALVAEADGSLPALRDAREHRRLFQRLLADFERSLVAAPAAKKGPPQLTLEEHLAMLAARKAENAA